MNGVENGISPLFSTFRHHFANNFAILLTYLFDNITVHISQVFASLYHFLMKKGGYKLINLAINFEPSERQCAITSPG